MLTEGLNSMEDVILYGPLDARLRTGVTDMNIRGMDPAELAYILDSEYGIMVRSGIHCAPHAHKTVGTYPSGSVRLSLGYFNTGDDVEYTLDAFKKITSKNREV